MSRVKELLERMDAEILSKVNEVSIQKDAEIKAKAQEAYDASVEAQLAEIKADVEKGYETARAYLNELLEAEESEKAAEESAPVAETMVSVEDDGPVVLS